MRRKRYQRTVLGTACDKFPKQFLDACQTGGQRGFPHKIILSHAVADIDGHGDRNAFRRNAAGGIGPARSGKGQDGQQQSTPAQKQSAPRAQRPRLPRRTGSRRRSEYCQGPAPTMYESPGQKRQRKEKQECPGIRQDGNHGRKKKGDLRVPSLAQLKTFSCRHAPERFAIGESSVGGTPRRSGFFKSTRAARIKIIRPPRWRNPPCQAADRDASSAGGFSREVFCGCFSLGATTGGRRGLRVCLSFR